MEKITEILNQGWIGTAVGFAGIIIAIIAGYYFKPRPRLAMQTNTLELVGPNAVLPNEIEFLFRGNKVPNVTLSKIALWNIGNTTIKGEQIVTRDPLRIITSEGSNILETTILNRTRQVNDVSCIPRTGTSNEIECRFDYFDPGDGVLVQLIHTGTNKVKVSGTLRGIPKGVLIVGSPEKDMPQKNHQMTPFAGKIIALLLLCFGLVAFGGYIMGKAGPQGDDPLLVGILFISLGLIMFLAIGYSPPSKLSTQIVSNNPRKWFWQTWIK